MKVTKELNNKEDTKFVGAPDHRCLNRGITLIALIITIIVMLILVAVTINMAINGGLFEKAGQAVGETKNEIKKDQELSNGKIQIEGVWYDSLDDYMNGKPSLNQGEKRTIKVETTKTEGEELWNSTVTLKISLEEETNLTLEQKRNIAAFMLDCSSYEEFKNFIGNYVADGSSYEQFVDGEEEAFLDAVIDIMKNLLSFKEPYKLESLGIKVISVKTPYDTTLYTTSLGGDIECTFIKNGSYRFTIQSGASQVTETVEVNNIRNYDDQGQHDVKIDFYAEDSVPVIYAIDNSEEWNNLSSTILSCNNSISYKLDNLDGFTWISYVIKDEQYYKYFTNENVWRIWCDNRGGYLFAWVKRENNMSCRQLLFLIMLKNDANIIPYIR